MEINTPYTAHDALADVDSAADAVRRRGVSPRGFYLAHGACTATLILGMSVLPRPIGTAAILLAGAALALLIRWYREATGIWITPASAPPRARAVWAAYAVALVALVAVTAILTSLGHAWIGWPAAVVALMGSVIIGHFLEPLLFPAPAGRTA